MKTDKNGNCIIMDITIQGKRITLVNIYGPNQDNPNFYTNVLHKIAEFENDQIILCGDWNFILDLEMDCENYVRINNLSKYLSITDKNYNRFHSKNEYFIDNS